MNGNEILKQNVSEEMKVSDILRQTAVNSNELMLRIADHIDKLESEVLSLTNQIKQLENK